VEVAGDYSNDLETLTQAMVSDTNPYDVLFLSLNYMPVDRLLQKGYCADLSGDEALMDVARSMYPQFGEILMKDGKLYGLPVDASASTYSVNMDAWEALGLTEDDLPKTLLDLMEFTANWAFDYGDDYSEYFLFDWVNQSSFFSMILSEYLTYIQKKEFSTRRSLKNFCGPLRTSISRNWNSFTTRTNPWTWKRLFFRAIPLYCR